MSILRTSSAARFFSAASPGPSSAGRRPFEGGFNRIRNGILTAAAGLLVVTGAGVILGTLEERAEAINEAHYDALVLSRAVEHYVGRIVERTGMHLATVRDAAEAAGGAEAMSTARLDALLAQRPVDEAARRNIVIVDAEGIPVAMAGAHKVAIPSVADRRYFHRHLADRSRAPLVSAAMYSRVDSALRLPISVRIDRPDGSFGGVVITTLDVEYLARYFEALGVKDDGRVALVTPDGQYLVRHPTSGHVQYPAYTADLAGMLREVEGTGISRSPVNGEMRVGAYRRLGNYPAYAIVSFAQDAVLATWRRNAIRRALGGAAVLVITAVFTFVLLRQLRREREATANLANFRRAVDVSGDFIYWFDARGNVAYMNASAARRLGTDPAHLPAGLHARNISANHAEDRWRRLWETLRREGEVSYVSEHLAHDGSRYPVQVSATHVQTDGEAFAFLIGRDLSEQRRQEAEIQELNASLEQRVRERTLELDHANAELESFAYSVSHDLRAPLNHLAAYAGLLCEVDPADGAERKRLSDKIIERSGYMNELIDALLALSRVTRSPLECREVDISGLAAEIDAEHRKLEPDRDVQTRVAPAMRAMGDPVLIRTLLENLIGNAWKYTSREPHARIEFGTEAVEGARAFVVRDNGAGFDSRYAARLFGPFHRLHTQAEFKGNGVGLATARRIVTRHGGRIWAESAPGAGATFRFTLP
jgi:PAS domain S-box-containing protein